MTTKPEEFRMTENQNVVVAAFRRAADLIERNPEVPAPAVGSDGRLMWWLYSWECPDGVPAMVAAIRRAVGGKWDKRETATMSGDDEMVFEREGYMVTVKRESVCVRRVVGTETVTLPAVDAQPERTVEREVIEWDCEPVLTAGQQTT